MSSDLSQLIIIFPTLAAGIIGWFLNRWINNNDKKNEKVSGHESELAVIKNNVDQIKDTVTRIEMSLEKLEDKREKSLEDLFKVKSKVDAAWRAIESINRQRDL